MYERLNKCDCIVLYYNVNILDYTNNQKTYVYVIVCCLFLTCYPFQLSLLSF